jgi:hypothetical protein
MSFFKPVNHAGSVYAPDNEYIGWNYRHSSIQRVVTFSFTVISTQGYKDD